MRAAIVKRKRKNDERARVEEEYIARGSSSARYTGFVSVTSR